MRVPDDSILGRQLTFLEEQKLKIVRKALSDFPAYRGVQANENVILGACQNGPMSLDVARAALNQIKHQLVVSPAYLDAYRIFFEAHPEFALEANMRLFDEAPCDSGEEISVDALEDLFHPGSPSSVRPNLSLNAEALKAQADAQEKTRLIVDISRGQSTYTARDRYGKTQTYRTAELDGESIERLREIADIVLEQRRFLAMPLADQKKEINTALKQQWTEKTQKQLPLPSEYEVPGKIGVKYPWSRALLVRIHTQAPEEYKRLQRAYGEQTIADIIVNNGVAVTQ